MKNCFLKQFAKGLKIILFAAVVLSFSLSAVLSYSAEKNPAILYNNGKFLSAINEYKHLADNGNIEGTLNLAVIFKDLGRYNEALFVLKKALSKAGSDNRILTLLGRIYYLDNQPQKARGFLEKALALDPDSLENCVTLGLTYEELAEFQKAQSYFEKALALNSSNVLAKISLADLYFKENKVNRAIEEYKSVGLLDASIIKVQEIIAELLFKINNFEEARKIYKKMALIDPKNVKITARLEDIRRAIGKEETVTDKIKPILTTKLITPFIGPLDVKKVRVRIISKVVSVQLVSSTPFQIKDTKDLSFKSVLPQKTLCTITTNEQGALILSYQVDTNVSGETAAKEIILGKGQILVSPINPEGTNTLLGVSLGKDNFWAEKLNKSYRGVLEISSVNGALEVINIVNLEEYLYSVVPSEMPADWPKESLKAQAVAARSEAISKLGRHKENGFDFCSEVHCQTYAGVEKETLATTTAVEETRGIVMQYNSKTIDAVYSSNCGGHTQSYIFGSPEDMPYLNSIIDAKDSKFIFPLTPLQFEDWIKRLKEPTFCSLNNDSKASSFRWVRIYSASELNGIINNTFDAGQLRKIIVLKREDSGHISSVKVVGVKNSFILDKELNIRKALGNLRSSMFKVEIKYGANKQPDKFIFFGGGWGHGVGMCQRGSRGMAQSGFDYKQILQHYFKGIVFKKLY